MCEKRYTTVRETLHLLPSSWPFRVPSWPTCTHTLGRSLSCVIWLEKACWHEGARVQSVTRLLWGSPVQGSQLQHRQDSLLMSLGKWGLLGFSVAPSPHYTHWPRMGRFAGMLCRVQEAKVPKACIAAFTVARGVTLWRHYAHTSWLTPRRDPLPAGAGGRCSPEGTRSGSTVRSTGVRICRFVRFVWCAARSVYPFPSAGAHEESIRTNKVHQRWLSQDIQLCRLP